MAKYLVKYDVKFGFRYQTTERVVVNATDPGYAKYHWHRYMNNSGHQKQEKHEYDNHDIGARFELFEVRELNESEPEDVALIDEFASIPGFSSLE